MESEWRRMSTGRGFWLSVVLCVAGLLAGITWPSEAQPSGTFFTMVQSLLCKAGLLSVAGHRCSAVERFFPAGMEERISEGCAA